MFRVILLTQWKWSRLLVILGAVAGAALPILTAQGAVGRGNDPALAASLLQTSRLWGFGYPIVAAALGLLVAITAWAPDHRGRHVHALVLPIPRARYVTLKYLAGLTLLAVPVGGVLAGAAIAALLAPLPPGLHTYPIALVARFALATAVAYSIFFAVSGATARTAGIILAAVAALMGIQVLASAAGIPLRLDLLVVTAVLQWPGPFAVFTGHWMFIDV